MSALSLPAKRTMRNPAAHIGRRVDPSVWDIPDGYALCAKTWKLFREDDLLITFNHHAFDRDFLRKNDILVEDADWLSEEGWCEIMDVLAGLDLYDAYIEASFHGTMVLEGRA